MTAAQEARHRRALELAEQCEAMADGSPQWHVAASLLRQAAASLRWEVQWEAQHPPTARERAVLAHADAVAAAVANMEPDEAGNVTFQIRHP